jgi:hypothetical protein
MGFRLVRFGGALAALALVPSGIAVVSSPALANNSYGAIYYSENADAVGFSWSQSSESDAENVALQDCQTASNGASDCKFQVKFHSHLCGAFASDSNSYNTGRGDTAAEALADASKTIDKNDSSFFSEVHCNSDRASDAAADLGSAIGGLIRALAGPPRATATARPTAAPTPQTNYSANTPPPYYVNSQPVQPITNPNSPPSGASNFFATPAPIPERYALVGLKVVHGDVVDAIIPMYAKINPGFVLGAPFDAPRLGQATSKNEPTILSVPGSIITDITVESGLYLAGATAVHKLTVGFSKLGPNGLAASPDQFATVAGSHASTLTAKDLRASPGNFFLKFNVVPATVASGGGFIVVGDVTVEQAQL